MNTLSQPLPYTASPAALAAQDLWLFFRITFVWPITRGLPSIVLPFYPWRSGPLDELYLWSFGNVWALSLHALLILTQSLFLILLLLSLLGVPVPVLAWTPGCIFVVVVFVLGNNVVCILLNGTGRRFQSLTNPDWQDRWESHDDEKWIFVNGVAVGHHWMQSNLDRLALTFRRPIYGIHNKTRGCLFDVIECIIQRTFGYATPDIRVIYADVIKFIEEKTQDAHQYNKIVLILHSQGAIEGGLVLDWLFATIDRDLLKKLEVYTFGSAANHFNSPEDGEGNQIVRHIEHYANTEDYVALFGILHFRPIPRAGNAAYHDNEARQRVENTYVGRMFVRKGSGHQMNGNYLDDCFAMKSDEQGRLLRVKECNDFMSSNLNEEIFAQYEIASKESEKGIWNCPLQNNCNRGVARRVKDVSRLWCYRNGRSPDD